MDTSSSSHNSSRVVCRYFSTKGECYYGSECQYLHQSPLRPELAAESKLSRWLPVDSSSGADKSPKFSSRPAFQPASSLFPAATTGGQRFTGSQSAAMTQLPLGPSSFFVADETRLQLLHRQALALALPDPSICPEVPQRVDNFQDLCPLEPLVSQQSASLRHVTSVFKATDIRTGDVVCLRRVHSFAPSVAMKGVLQVVDAWKKVNCSNIAALRHVFVTKEFGDTSLIFVYDYFAGAKTLSSQYLASSVAGGSLNGVHMNRPYSQQQVPKLLPEPLIWNYVIQLSAALRVIHSQGLAYRALEASKVLMTNGWFADPQYVTAHALQQQLRQQPRLRLSCCGLLDFLTYESAKEAQRPVLVAQQQQEDLQAFGKLCLVLACNSMQAIEQSKWQQSLELVSRNYSPDLRALICHLLSAKHRSVNDIMPMIGARFYAQLDLCNQRFDVLEHELIKELDNSRLFRLLCKLGCINERPEHRLDPQWAETGDRYLVKLFRDYLMYQMTEDGTPVLDLSHIVTNLNKLEQASPERLCLVSRDEQNVLIVSYAELKKCFDSSFDDLFPCPEPQR